MYIRTKDGVYKVDEIKPYFLDEKQKLFISNELKIAVNENQVIEQADTIEELCDEFVVIRDNTKINQLIRTDNIEYLKEMMKEDKRIVAVKGAIWTDFGLKYVAVLTENGGVELI